MSKNCDAKRRAKLKARRRNAEQQAVLTQSKQAKIAEWIASHHAEPNVIAELVDAHGISICRVEGNNDEGWIVVVGQEPAAGSNDTFAALSLLLSAAVDDRAHVEDSYIQFSPWLTREVERRCEAGNVSWDDFLRSLLPCDKRQLSLPHQRTL